MSSSITKLILMISMSISMLGTISHAYMFGMLSSDDKTNSITTIENAHNIRLPMISFIWDDFSYVHQQELSLLNTRMGSDRIYHITLSPVSYSAAEVIQGKFDESYIKFFTIVKEQGIKVVFRTMHEMNGGRYPRSGDPANFKLARQHVYNLSREAGLDKGNIVFSLSVNARDMPPSGGATPSQTTNLITCTQSLARSSGCLTWEDYYPGDEYVDLMGVSFYNWGKATSNRQRLSPIQIMEEPIFNVRNRLVSKGKPIIVDEAGTTSVRYNQAYQRALSINNYSNGLTDWMKNQRLLQLTAWAKSKTELVGLNYFNVDLTQGLRLENPGEADWSIIDMDNDKYYSGAMQLYNGSRDDLSRLFVPTKLLATQNDKITNKAVTASTFNSANSKPTTKINKPVGSRDRSLTSKAKDVKGWD